MTHRRHLTLITSQVAPVIPLRAAPSATELNLRVVDAAQTLSDEVLASGEIPDHRGSIVERALLGLLDSVHALECYHAGVSGEQRMLMFGRPTDG